MRTSPPRLRMVACQCTSISRDSKLAAIWGSSGVSSLPVRRMAVTSQTRTILPVSPTIISNIFPALADMQSGVQLTLQQIDLVTRLRDAYPKDFSPNVNSSTAMTAFEKGQIISPMGVEGLHQIGNSVANLRRYHAMGVRYSTLTHNCHNIFADAAILEGPMRKAEPHWGGLSPLGRRVVLEMNRLGMLVDLSHVRCVSLSLPSP
jgi:microsomal dipeptidase-like Zn-dependent dipeptidase